MNRLKIGITTGDPAGIGPEIVWKALQYYFPEYGDKIQFICVGSKEIFAPHVFSELEKDWERFQQNQFLVLIPPDFHPAHVIPCMITPETGRFSAGAFRQMLELAARGIVDVIVTGPVDKKALEMAGIREADHTAMMENFYGCSVDTLFKVRRLKIYFYTKHIPLLSLRDHLSGNRLLEFFRRCVRHEFYLGSRLKKSIAVAAINPHASDGGRFGSEEQEILIPAITQAQAEGLPVEGPFPADSVYHQALNGQFAAVISLYHDQGHIASKMVDFYRTVSFSLGAPVLRTSVDHGTALDIAGKGMASPVSMISAIREAMRFGKIYKEKIRQPFDR